MKTVSLQYFHNTNNFSKSQCCFLYTENTVSFGQYNELGIKVSL